MTKSLDEYERVGEGPLNRRWNCRSCHEKRVMKYCLTCKSRKPPEEFAATSKRQCEACREKANSFTCFHCYETKHRSEFSVKSKRVRPVCRRCRKKAADRKRRERLARARAQAARTWTDEHGVQWRRCARCSATGPLYEGNEVFSPERRGPDGEVARWSYHCRACKRASMPKKAKRTTEQRLKQNAYNRAWRKRNPEAAAEAHRRWWDKVKQDPERYRRHLETRRIRATLRAMQEGREMGRRPDMTGREMLTMPSAPLAAAIAADERRDEDICEWSDFTARNAFAWRVGSREEVKADVADRFLQTLGLLWWEVWSPESCRRYVLKVVTYHPVVRSKRKKSGELRDILIRERTATRWYLDYAELGEDGVDHEGIEKARRAFEGELREAA